MTDVVQEVERLIERRASKGETDPDELEPSYAESVGRHREKLREENRLAWYFYHLDAAERLRRTMTSLIEEHEARALALLEEGS